MWVTFTVMEAAIVFGAILIAVVATKVADRAFVRRTMKDVDKEYRTLTGSRRA